MALWGPALAGCAPPALPEDPDGGPAVRFVFPTSDLDGPVCPDFLVAVNIDNFEVVPPDASATPEDGHGHWHLDDDITGDYFPLEDSFLDFSAELDGAASRAYRLTASLVNIDHSPLDQGRFPLSVATVEFDVADEEGCLGGGGAGAGR